jgi:tetratricopeptide (TPR) repeat protein
MQKFSLQQFLSRPWLVSLTLIAVVIAIYGWFLKNPFLMDDEVQILMNMHIKSLDNIWSFFGSSTMYSGGREEMFGVYFKPLMTLYYALIWNFFGESSAAFRFPLILAHALSAVMIFLLLRKRIETYSAGLIATTAAFVFAIHPVNSEVVLYIADVQDTMYFCFGLMGLMLIEFCNRNFILAPLFFITLICALLFKETGGIFIVLSPLYAWYFHRQKTKVIAACALLTVVVYAGLRLNSGLVDTTNMELMFHNASFWKRFKMLPLILWHYFELLVFPWRLSVTHDFVMTGFPLERFWFPLFAVMILISFAVYALKLNPWIAKANGFRWIMVLLVLWFILHGQLIVPLDGVYADRWIYPVSAVFAFGFAYLLVLKNWNAGIKIAIFTLVSTFFIARTIDRGMHWKNPLKLFLWEATLNPDHALMTSNVGHELLKAGNASEALKWFEQSMKNNPYWSVSVINAGAAHEALGNMKLAEEYYRKAIQMAGYPFAYENLVKLLYNQKRYDELISLIRNEALKRYPKNEMFLKVDNFFRRIEQTNKDFK